MMRIAAFFIVCLALCGCTAGWSRWNAEPWPDAAVTCEDFAIDDDGRIWSVADVAGEPWFVRYNPPGHREPWSLMASALGKPLGMRWRTEVGVVVADADGRLQAIDPRGFIHTLVWASHVDGQPLGLVNGVAVARDGSVYFTESSRRHTLGQITAASLLGDDTGRLLEWDAVSGDAHVIADGFVFANGVAVVDDGDALLVAETFARRITKVHVAGPRKGEREIWVDDLPGYPDNLDVDDRGLVWVAIYAEHSKELDIIRSIPMLPELLVHPVRAAEKIKGGRFEPKAVGRILAYDTTGNLVHDLRDPNTPFAPLTSVRAHGDKLYLVAPSAKPSIGVMDRPR